MGPEYIFGIPLKREVDIGHFLTALTLIAGFAWWVYTTLRAAHRTRQREAGDGALRLLLWLLRQRHGQPVSLDELQEEFNSPELRERRRAYCKKNYQFKTQERFEAAIYALDWEGKVDFVGSNAVAFRVDKTPDQLKEEQQRRERQRPALELTPDDRATLLALFEETLWNREIDQWRIQDLAETAARAAPERTKELLRRAMSDSDTITKLKAAHLLGKIAERNR